MSKVTCEIPMSLDGFVAGPNVRAENGMGDDGERLFEELGRDRLELLKASAIETSGATHFRFEVVR